MAESDVKYEVLAHELAQDVIVGVESTEVFLELDETEESIWAVRYRRLCEVLPAAFHDTLEIGMDMSDAGFRQYTPAEHLTMYLTGINDGIEIGRTNPPKEGEQ